MRNLGHRAAAALLALAVAACGAGADDPAPANPLPPATCPPLGDLAPGLLAHIREGRLDGLRRVVESLDPDELAVLLDGVLRLVKGLKQSELLALLKLGENEKLRALLPLVVDLLRAVGGDPASPGSFRADVVAELARVVHGCDFDRMFAAVDRMLGSPELPEMLGRLAEVLRTPFVQDLLRSDASGALGPDGFVRVVLLVLERMAAPDFDFGAFRGVLAAVPALRSEEPPLVGLMASLERLLADPALFPPLQDLTCCYLYDRPTCADAGGGATLVSQRPPALVMMYDLFVDQSAHLDALLDSLADLAADPEIGRTLEPLRVVVRQLAESDDIRGKLVRLLELLLRPDNARAVLPELVLLLETGATDELLALADAVLDGCDPREAE